MIYAENNYFTITSIFGSKMSYFAWTITFTEPQLSNTGFNSVFKVPWSYPYLMMPWICLRHPKPAGAKQSEIPNSSMLECMGDVHLFEGYIWFCVNKEMVCFTNVLFRKQDIFPNGFFVGFEFRQVWLVKNMSGGCLVDIYGSLTSFITNAASCNCHTIRCV